MNTARAHRSTTRVRPLTAPAAGHVLAIDIGGSGLKAAVVAPDGALLCDRVRVDTPVGAPPEAFVATLASLVADLPSHTGVAVGFPGMVRDGVVLTAPNLGNDDWVRYPLAARLEEALGKPVRLANDADVHGLAVIEGRGLEIVITLGTGFGTSLYADGRLCPHLEIAHLPFRKGETYDQQLGERARKKIGNRKWRKRVLQAIENLRVLTHFDRLWVGGGNGKRLAEPLPDGVALVDNRAGLSGGAFLFHGA